MGGGDTGEGGVVIDREHPSTVPYSCTGLLPHDSGERSRFGACRIIQG